MKRLRQFAILFLSLWCAASANGQVSGEAIPVIFDSDMGPDYDDVGAITVLHAFADSGDVRILATIASTKYQCVACVMQVFNTYFNRPDIPIGVPKGDALQLRDWQHWTDSLVAKFPHVLKSNEQAEDAVTLYRRILSSQADSSVVIITTGFLTNLSNLLLSQADRYSPLNGRELVHKKVKRLVSMAGKFPAGGEFNLNNDVRASQNVFSNWPVSVIFSGFEIGQKIKTGLPLIRNDDIHGSPVKKVFSICIPMAKEDSGGRMSWDETAVLVAIKGYSSFYTLVGGHIVIAPDGSNAWLASGTNQAYLKEAAPASDVESYLNRLIQHQPVK